MSEHISIEINGLENFTDIFEEKSYNGHRILYIINVIIKRQTY